MKQIFNTFGGIAGLAVAGLAGLALFTVIGGLLIVAGVVITAVLVGGGVYALVTGRGKVTTGMRRGPGGVHVFDLRTGQSYDRAGESEMIDITPPKRPKEPGKGNGPY